MVKVERDVSFRNPQGRGRGWWWVEVGGGRVTVVVGFVVCGCRRGRVVVDSRSLIIQEPNPDSGPGKTSVGFLGLVILGDFK